MEGRMFFQSWVLSTISFFVSGFYSLFALAEQDFLPRAQLRAPFSNDISVIDRYKNLENKYQIQTSNEPVLSNINSVPLSFQDQAGAEIYKSMSLPENKRQERLAGAAIMYGVEQFGYSTQLKSGLQYVKQKTRYSFGECSQVRLSTKRLKARSCLNDEAKIEFKSSYKLNSFTLDFKWPL